MIRSATAEDLPAISHLIRQLAKHARQAHEVKFDERELREHLFGPRPWAETLLAEEAGQVVGFALFFHNYSTFAGKPGLYLEDLYIEPEHRGRGHGKALFQAVVRLAVERDCRAWNGRCLTGTSPRFASIARLGPAP